MLLYNMLYMYVIYVCCNTEHVFSQCFRYMKKDEVILKANLHLTIVGEQ